MLASWGRCQPRATLLLVVLLFGTGVPVHALGRLIQPGGSVTVLGEASGPEGKTLLFPQKAVPVTSWLVLPPGSLVREARIVTSQGQMTLTFPSVGAPGVRLAFEVPGPLRSLTLRGRLPETLTLFRTLGRPGNPGVPWITRSLTELRLDLPAWKVAEGFASVLTLHRTAQTPWEAAVSGAGKSRRFTFQPSVTTWSFAPAAWGFMPTRIQIPGPDAELSDVQVKAFAPGAGIQADPKTLLAWPAKAWRDPRREWFSWSGTTVLVLITADYRVQDDYLKRLAFFVEKAGYRGRLVPDAEIASLHGWNAHDYAAPDLARFYTQAAAESFPLNGSETELRDKLVETGILLPEGPNSWVAGAGALVGISDQSPPALKAVLFGHEAFHGLYYTSEEFRSGVASVWEGLSEGARNAFRSFLAMSQYDPGNEALMVNEFQAYLLQRSALEWQPFLRERVLSQSAEPEKTAWLAEILAGARVLDALVQRLYGLKSGDVSLIKTF